MGPYKQFLSSDVIVTPFVVNKGFTFTPGTSSGEFSYFGYTSSLTAKWVPNDNIIEQQAVGIDKFIAESGSTSMTGLIISSLSGSVSSSLSDYTQYRADYLYSSIQQLYYSNFLSSSTGDTVSRPVLVPGSEVNGNVYVGTIKSPLYDNYLQSTLTPTRFWPTESGAKVGVVSIPSKLYGDYVQPKSVRFRVVVSGSAYVFVDDGEGNLILENSIYNVGNVIYPHGIITFTNSASYNNNQGEGPFIILAGYGSDIYGNATSVYGGSSVIALPSITDLCNSENFTASFSSSYTIYETQYKCTLGENEFNSTLNPSVQSSGSMVEVLGNLFYQPGNGQIKDNLTGSYFSPYVASVGLYDEKQNLLAVGKLSQPLPTSTTVDTTILVNLDR
tara:strand:+ start:1112 stop:2275 length:1164 start_codon:yes stop_codon:yes gene_type:complete